MNSLAPSSHQQVFRDFAPRVYRRALRILGNESEAEDVASEVLLRLMREWGTFRGESWLDRITSNAARKRQRALPCSAGS